MRLEDFIEPSAIKELTAPTGEALGLPGNIYGDDFYELEKRELFPKLWAAVAVGAQLPQGGDLLPVELAGQPLLRHEIRQSIHKVSACKVDARYDRGANGKGFSRRIE